MIFCGVSLTHRLGKSRVDNHAVAIDLCGSMVQALWLAASRMVCSRMEKAGERAVSVRMVKPTGPLVSSLFTREATKAPLLNLLAMTPRRRGRTKHLVQYEGGGSKSCDSSKSAA